jgi:hypothetical protein
LKLLLQQFIIASIQYILISHIFCPVQILCAILGAGMAPIYATGILWVEERIKITNKIGATFTICAMAGPNILPAVVGNFIVQGRDSPKIL